MSKEDCEFDWCYDPKSWKKAHTQRTIPDESHIHCCIPFVGTYGAISEDIAGRAEFDDELTYRVDEDKADKLKMIKLRFDINSFVEDYTAYIANLLKTPSLQFSVMESPREYNFATDSIICTISRQDAWKLYCQRDKNIYDDLVKNATTPHPGFLPFYTKTDMVFFDEADLPVNNAALLIPLLGCACIQALSEISSYTYDKDFNYIDYELYLDYIDGGDHPIDLFSEYDHIFEEDSIESKSNA